MDFGIGPRLTPADYAGLDLTPVRELKKAQDGEKVRAKHEPDAGTIARGQHSLQQRAQALERASKKLDSAGQTVHQVEDLLYDTLRGFRANRAEHRHPSANERLLKSADETAADIVGLARFDEEALFPPSTSPVKFETKKALDAYAQHRSAMKDVRGLADLPEVAAVLARTNDQFRGDDGVLPTLGRLAVDGAHDPDGTDQSLSGLRENMATARQEISAVRTGLVDDHQIDLAS